MKEALIDTSKNHIGIMIAEGIIIKIFNKELRKSFGKTIHMRELSPGEKLSVLRAFDRLFENKKFSRDLVQIYCIKTESPSFWANLIRELVNKDVDTLNVDYEVMVALKKYVNGILLRTIRIYVNKETLQFADIIAYANSHHPLVKNIWKNVPLVRGGH